MNSLPFNILTGSAGSRISRLWAFGLLALLLSFGIARPALGAETHPAAPAHGSPVAGKNLAAGAHAVPAGTEAADVPMVKRFAFSYLTAYMFFLSFCVGALFLVLMHHLFDAGWSVPIRRFLEQIAFLFPVMAVLFIPIALLAKQLYPWMNLDPATDHALKVKLVLFNPPTFYGVSAVLFVVWTWLTWNLRRWSLEQDKTGAARCTIMLRRYSAGGIFLFAFSVTFAAIYWMKSLQHQFFSTMYGVYYFAGSVWVTLGTVYMLAAYFKKNGPLTNLLGRQQFYFLGTLFFAFTVFYAYIHFSQYFLIWNAAIPEETFWYVLRESGTYQDIGLILIFGHFLAPFLLLLRIDWKLKFPFMAALAVWAWVMHYLDMTFNIMPVLYPKGVNVSIFDPLCLGVIGYILYNRFFANFNSHPPYPLKDPRLHEVLEQHHAEASHDPVASEGGAH